MAHHSATERTAIPVDMVMHSAQRAAQDVEVARDLAHPLQRCIVGADVRSLIPFCRIHDVGEAPAIHPQGVAHKNTTSRSHHKDGGIKPVHRTLRSKDPGKASHSQDLKIFFFFSLASIR